MKKDMTIKEIQHLESMAEKAVEMILNQFEGACPMITERIELYEELDTGKTRVKFVSYCFNKGDTYIKSDKME